MDIQLQATIEDTCASDDERPNLQAPREAVGSGTSDDTNDIGSANAVAARCRQAGPTLAPQAASQQSTY